MAWNEVCFEVNPNFIFNVSISVHIEGRRRRRNSLWRIIATIFFFKFEPQLRLRKNSSDSPFIRVEPIELR